MIKTKLGDIAVAVRIFSRVATREFEDVKVGYWFSKLIQKMDQELKVLNAKNFELLDKYATKDEKGGFVMDEATKMPSFTPENKELMDKEWHEVLEKEVTMENVFPLKLNKLVDRKGNPILTPSDNIQVAPFLNVEELEKELGEKQESSTQVVQVPPAVPAQ